MRPFHRGPFARPQGLSFRRSRNLAGGAPQICSLHGEEEKGKGKREKKEQKHRLEGGVLSSLKKKGPVRMAERVSQCEPRRGSSGVKPAFPPAGAGQTRPPPAENPGRGRATVIEVLGTWLQ